MNTMRGSNSIQMIGKLALGILLVCLLGGATCDQPFGPTTTGSGTTHKTYHAFGDSLAAGYKHTGLFPGQIKSYVGYYADEIAADRGWTITYRGTTASGATTTQIHNRMKTNLARLREAEIFTWDAGPNDFLDARSEYYNECDSSRLMDRLEEWRADWDALLDTVRDNVGMEAASAPMIRTTNIYYPNPDQDRGGACPGERNHFEVFLPILLSAGDYMCSSAEIHGWRCADSFAAMNCNEDENGNPDFRCTNKRYLQRLVDKGVCPRSVTSPMYREPSIDPECIRAYLDATGDWAVFQDPSSVSKNGEDLDLIQVDAIHPNAQGHIRIGLAHHDIGYDDVDNENATESNYALCVDYVDNDGDGDADCADSDCSVYCNY